MNVCAGDPPAPVAKRAALQRRADQEADVLAVRAKLELAELQVRESKQAKIKANRALALMLNLPLDDVDGARGARPHRPAPPGPDAAGRDWSRRPWATGPICSPSRCGVRRAEADINAARANAYPDVYVLYQPYTFQNNTYLGVPSAYSWTLGLTATIPLYNRNQGNITRAKINMNQTQVQAASVERHGRQRRPGRRAGAGAEPDQRRRSSATRSSRPTRRCAMPRISSIPRARPASWTTSKPSSTYNEVVKQYRDALVRHRRAILDLNTAVGERILP